MDEVYDALRSGHFVEENGSPLKLQHPLRAAYLARQGKAFKSSGFHRQLLLSRALASPRHWNEAWCFCPRAPVPYLTRSSLWSNITEGLLLLSCC
jgi:hypothetical protein